MTTPHLAASIPPGWRLECPQCNRADGQHQPHCRGVAVPRKAGSPALGLAAQPGQVPQVTPVRGGRLEQLLGLRKAAQAAAAEAASRLTAIEAGIKAEAGAVHPGCGIVDIAGGPGWGALRLRWHDGALYVPAGELREQHPDIWKKLARSKRGSWQLHELGDGA